MSVPAPAQNQRPSVLAMAHILSLSVVQYIVAFVGSAIVARALGPAGRGAYYLPLLAANTCLVFGKLGIDQANVFLYSTAGIELRRLSAQNGTVALGSGAILIAVVATLPVVIPEVFSSTPLLMLLVAGLTIPLGIHTQLTGSLLAMSGAVRRQYVGGLSSAVVQVLATIVLEWMRLLTIWSALLLAVLGSVVNWTVVVWHIVDDPQWWLRFDLPLLKRTLRSSLVLHAGMILFFLHLRMDMFMVKAWLGTAALGQYSIAVALAETLMLATDAVAVAVLPTQMNNTLGEAAHRALRAARFNALLACSIAVVFGIGSSFAIRLVFGKAYAPAVIPTLLLLPGVATLGMQRVCGAPVLRTGRTSGIAAIYGVTLIVNIILNVLWIPRLGIAGASLASTLSYALGAVLFLAWTSRLAQVSIWRALRFDSADFLVMADAARSGMAVLRALVTSDSVAI